MTWKKLCNSSDLNFNDYCTIRDNILSYSKGEQGSHVGENVAVIVCVKEAHIKFLMWIMGWEMGYNWKIKDYELVRRTKRTKYSCSGNLNHSLSHTLDAGHFTCTFKPHWLNTGKWKINRQDSALVVTIQTSSLMSSLTSAGGLLPLEPVSQ